jgi:hypothetical protein
MLRPGRSVAVEHIQYFDFTGRAGNPFDKAYSLIADQTPGTENFNLPLVHKKTFLNIVLKAL